jgi:hypothetical protein
VVGKHLCTNSGAQLSRVDAVEVQDMTFSCVSLGFPEHRGCSSNIAETIPPWGFKTYLEAEAPFNCLGNTPLHSIKR